MEKVQQTVREFRAITKRVSISTTIALWVCLTMTIAMFVVSICLPPYGEIHPSIFKGAGVLFAFATLFEVREAIREGLGAITTPTIMRIRLGDILCIQ